MSEIPTSDCNQDAARAHGSSLQRMVRPRLTDSKWVNSCDTCRHQEGRHYCLMHSITLKNMDTIRCDDHQDRGRGKRHNSPNMRIPPNNL